VRFTEQSESVLKDNDDDLVVRFLDDLGAVVVTCASQRISKNYVPLNKLGRTADKNNYPPPWIQTIVGKGTVEFTAGE
jgi:hypothetical protein